MAKKCLYCMSIPRKISTISNLSAITLPSLLLFSPRAWYAQTADPRPKDIVLVIDKSQSMSKLYQGKSLMSIVKDAASALLDSLNPNDRVSESVNIDNSMKIKKKATAK